MFSVGNFGQRVVEEVVGGERGPLVLHFHVLSQWRPEDFNQGLTVARLGGPGGLVVPIDAGKVFLPCVGVGDADVLGVEVFFAAFEAAFAAHAGLLGAARGATAALEITPAHDDRRLGV
jgi:hypothetical protein